MSARNTLEAKRLRRTRKLFRKELPSHIDLVQYLRDRGYADTAGGARQLLIDGKVKAESHTIGRIEIDVRIPGTEKVEKKTFAQPIVPAAMRNMITVLS